MKFLFNLLALLIVFNFTSCSSSKTTVEQNAIQISHAYFQDWTTDIKIGSSGKNIFLANLSAKSGVTVDSVYFRKLKGKLVKGRSIYYSQLIRMLPNSEGNKLMIEDFPFELNNTECMVSYTENGETKYLKVNNVSEREGVHYLFGLPREL